jgi:hypothetical protein
VSIIRDYEAEKEFALLKWLGEGLDKLNKSLERSRAATAVSKTPQEERDGAGPETAGAGRSFEDVQ